MARSAVSRHSSASPHAATRQPTPEPLWPGEPPQALGTTPADIPTLTVYKPHRAKSTGAAMVICPGGGYGTLADHEGQPVALWLNTLGITGIVFRYRLGPRYQHPVPLLDAARAMRTVRARAAEWKLDPGRLGILGFSAGGHLAASVCTHFSDGDDQAADPIERFSSRPDVSILLYPVITMTEPFTHLGSRQNLLGTTPLPELIDGLSNEKQVTSRTPPAFLFHTVDDEGVPVENSLAYAAALRRAQVRFELHLYEHGSHGVGLAQADPVLRSWPELCAAWLGRQGFAAAD